MKTNPLKNVIEFHDPIIDVIQAAVNMYGDVGCILQYHPKLPRTWRIGRRFGRRICGETYFPENEKLPVISLNPEVALKHLLEVLAHELAHVVVGPTCEHDKDWRYAFDRIADEYRRIVQEKFNESRQDED